MSIQEFCTHNATTFDRLPNSVVVINTRGLIVYSNAAWCHSIQLPCKKFKNTSVFNYYALEVRKSIRAVLKSGQDQQYVLMRHKCVQGEKLIEGSILSLKDRKNKITGAMIIGNDVTEHYELFGEIQRSREKYKSIFAYAPLGIVFSKLSGEIIAVNPHALAIFGYKKQEELIGKNAALLYTPTIARKKIIAELKDKKTLTNKEILLKNKQGKPITITATYRLVPENGQNYIETLFHDVTKEKKIEQQLKQNQELSHKILFQSPLGMLLADKTGKILSINKTLLSILGSPSEAATKKFNLFTMPLLKKMGISSLFHKAIKQNYKIESKDIQYVSFWGKKSWLKLTLLPLHEGDQQGLVVFVEDVSVRKERELDLEYYSKTLEHRVSNRTKTLLQHEQALKESNEKLLKSYEYIGKINRHLSSLISSSALLSSGLSYKEILQQILLAIYSVLNANIVFVRSYVPGKEQAFLQGSVGLNSVWKRKLQKLIIAEDHLYREFFYSTTIKVIENLSPYRNYVGSIVAQYDLQSAILVPLFYEKERLGLITIYFKETHKTTSFEKNLLPAFMAQASLVLKMMQQKRG